MNLRELKYLLALNQHKNFSKAADACFVSQPALSMQIKKLETELGVMLLERSNKSILFTPIGKIIIEKAQHILKHVDEVYTLASLANNPYGGEFKIGIIPTLAPYLLPFLMPALSKQFPKLTMYLVEEQTATLITKLRAGILDTAFLAFPISGSGFTHALLFKEEFLLAVPKEHPLSSRKKVTAADLDQEQILLLEEGHCMRGQTLDICRRVHAKEMQNFRATSLETLRHMVAHGNGITLMPKLAQQNNDNLVYIPFSSPKPIRSIALYSRTYNVRKNLLKEMSIAIKKVISDHLCHLD